MIKKILFLLLILTIASSTTCQYSTESSCLASSCFWGNGYCSVCNCTTCLTGYTYYSSSNYSGCIPCTTLPENNCTLLCVDYQYVPVLGCIPCTMIDPNCLTCSYSNITNSSQCTQCVVNYFINPNDPTNCIPTPCNIQYCLLCSTVLDCYSCKTGYSVILNGAACGPSTCSIPNCLTCLTATTCAVCYTCYQGNIDMTSCELPCNDPYCATCPTQNSCSQCINGYVFSSTTGYCVMICLVPYCVTCSSSTTCSTCQTNYVVGPTGTSCLPIGPSGCSIANSPTTCSTCQIGYYLLTNGTCAPTICYITQCLVCATTITCYQCSSITTINGNGTSCNYNCLVVVSNCITCTSNTTCSACAAGYLLNTTTNQCNPVCTIPDCYICLTDGLCQFCDVNYTLTSSGTCDYNCGIPNCISCNSSHSCQACNTNYQLSPDCSSCLLVCSPGFYINTVNGTQTCQLCSLTISSCYLCTLTSNNALTCLACWDMYYVTGDGSCSLCSSTLDNCLLCDSPAKCTQCNGTYVLYTNQIGAVLCEPTNPCNVADCQLCTNSSSQICATCLDSYQKSSDGTACTLIQCLSTQYYDPINQVCACPINTYLVNNQCTYCPFTHCSDCTSAGCTTCLAGYYVSAGKCASCPLHCITCTSSTKCTQCASDYTLSGNTCVWACGCNVGVTITLANGTIEICPAGCSNCGISSGGAIYCRTPSPGYSFDTAGDIIKCNSNCLTCAISNNNICTSCEGASILTGSFCLGCVDQYATACSPTNSAYSTDCIPGYSPFGGVCQACDPNCITCGNAGAGNCDNGQCNDGYVVIVNTHNCTACFNGCNTCNPADPSKCIQCSIVDYVDNSSQCQPCPSNCQSCLTATVCASCPLNLPVLSYGSCYALLDYPCYTQVGNNCTSCYPSYTYDNITKSCTQNIICNATSKCKSCPIYTYLKSGKCLACKTSSVTCNFCNPSNTSQCLTCATGYYFSSSDTTCYTCSSSMDGCLKCSSDSTCLSADVGYYIAFDAYGFSTGNILTCPASCATCNSPTCLTCASSYIRIGTLCIYEQYISGTITLGPGPGTPWFTYSQSDTNNLAYAVANAGQIMSSLLTIAGISASQFQNIIIIAMSSGSIKVEYALTGGPGVDGTTFHQNFSNNLNKIGLSDFTMYTTSTTMNGQTTTTNGGSGSGANLGLILGITIPLVILLIVVMIFIKIYSTDTDEKETEETDKGVNEYEM